MALVSCTLVWPYHYILANLAIYLSYWVSATGHLASWLVELWCMVGEEPVMFGYWFVYTTEMSLARFSCSVCTKCIALFHPADCTFDILFCGFRVFRFLELGVKCLILPNRNGGLVSALFSRRYHPSRRCFKSVTLLFARGIVYASLFSFLLLQLWAKRSFLQRRKLNSSPVALSTFIVK